MFVVLLKFSENKSQAGQFMQGHNIWLQKGFDDGVFLLAGSLQPQQGGAVLAHSVARSDLESRIKQDPFVQEKVVSYEIQQISPSKTDERLDFLAN